MPQYVCICFVLTLLWVRWVTLVYLIVTFVDGLWFFCWEELMCVFVCVKGKKESLACPGTCLVPVWLGEWFLVCVCVLGCSSPSALAVAQSLLVMHCLKETWGLQMQLNELVSFWGWIHRWLWCYACGPKNCSTYCVYNPTLFSDGIYKLEIISVESKHDSLPWELRGCKSMVWGGQQVKTGHHAWKAQSAQSGFLRNNASFTYLPLL